MQQAETSFFMQAGNKFLLTNQRNTQVHESLPAAVYDVAVSEREGFFLVPQTMRSLPAKIYGTVQLRADRILKTAGKRMGQGLATGVLLTGEKGSGKSLLANYLVQQAKMPTVLVNQAFIDPQFQRLLTAGGPKCVVFDEFEKVYHDPNKQTALLTMLDGQYDSQNLTIATLNDTGRIIDAMKNRPSRFFYHYQYAGVERQFIIDYCQDRLSPFTDTALSDILAVVSTVQGFNFDMLQALVEEMNTFGDTAQECLRHLNIKPMEFGLIYVADVYKPDGTPVKLASNEIRLRDADPHMIDSYIQLVAKDKTLGNYFRIIGDAYTGTNEKGALMFEYRGYKATIIPKYRTQKWSV